MPSQEDYLDNLLKDMTAKEEKQEEVDDAIVDFVAAGHLDGVFAAEKVDGNFS